MFRRRKRKTQTKKTVLKWWDYYSLIGFMDVIDDTIALYEALNPHIELQRTWIPYGELLPRILEAQQTGTLPDIMVIDMIDHQNLADRDILADLTGYINDWPKKDLYFEEPWASTLYQGRNYGVPFVSNTTALFCNMDMLAAAGYAAPPTTWDELREQAQKLTTEQHDGFSMATILNEEGTFAFLPWLWQSGSDLATLGDAGSIKTLTFLNTLVNVDRCMPHEEYGLGNVLGQFITGRCAMSINVPAMLVDADDAGLNINVTVAPLPKGKTSAAILGGANLAVGARTHVDEAWAFIDWLTDVEQLTSLVRSLGMSNRRDVSDEPQWADNQTIQFIVDQIATARARTYGPNYSEISRHIQTMYDNVYTGKQTPEAAAQTAAKRITPLLP